jgi:hypothetical protein
LEQREQLADDCEHRFDGNPDGLMRGSRTRQHGNNILISQQVELATMSVYILVGLVFALLVFLAVYVSRGKLKPQFPALGSQRMYPNCGRITSRSNVTGGRHPGQRLS